MGMFTEFHFNVELKADVPDRVIGTLKYMVGERSKPRILPEHDLFSCDRWGYMLQSGSYYFNADTHSTLRYDKIGRCHYLCIRCNLKNYDDEITKFVDWISSYLRQDEGDFLGFSRHEETQQPTLIYM